MTDENSLLRSATAKRKSALQLNSFNANNSTSVEPISKHWRKNNYNTYQCNRSKHPLPTLCAQTNAQPDYATLSCRFSSSSSPSSPFLFFLLKHCLSFLLFLLEHRLSFLLFLFFLAESIPFTKKSAFAFSDIFKPSTRSLNLSNSSSIELVAISKL